jgi:flotillin
MTPQLLITGVGVLALAGIVLLAAFVSIKNLLLIAGPNEVLVFSGPGGYKLLKGGRRMRIPLLERVAHMDLTNMTVDVTVTNAYSKGGIPLTVQGVANLKVASHQPQLGNALERFLNMPREAMIQVAKDTLEGNLRGVLSQLTPEEVNEDKIAFAEKMIEEAEQDLGKLGFALDVLKIQNVSDDVGYLDSLGRRTSAVLDRTAKIAEANATAESTKQDAQARQQARIAECEADIQIATAETARRVTDAKTNRHALVAKEVGEVSALIAKAQAEVAVQEARVGKVERQLQADVIASAAAEREASVAQARGLASKVVEDGKATAAVLEAMITTWKNGGDSARDIFLMEKLEKVMSSLVGTINQLKIDKITVLPSTGGQGATAARLSEELRASVGVDVPQLINQVGSMFASSVDDSAVTQTNVPPVAGLTPTLER